MAFFFHQYKWPSGMCRDCYPKDLGSPLVWSYLQNCFIHKRPMCLFDFCSNKPLNKDCVLQENEVKLIAYQNDVNLIREETTHLSFQDAECYKDMVFSKLGIQN